MAQSAVLVALLLLLVPWPAAAQLPGTPTITFGTPAATTVPMTTTWTPVVGAPSYVVNGAFNDNTAFFSASGVISPLTRAMPYHSSGAAAPGWTCVKVTGATEGACTGFTAPAKPATLPPVSTSHLVTFQEGTTNVDGTPLTTLASHRVYYQVDASPEQFVTVPASSPTGGQPRSMTLTIPFDSGTLSVNASSLNTQGAESGRSNTATKPLKPPTKPLPAGAGTLRFDP
jgi:hypothetical protein